MKKKNQNQRRHNFSTLRQLCNFIPTQLVSALARETGVDKMCRTFSAWSHVVAMLYAQLTHSIGLNDLCDSLQLHSGPLSTIRGATPPRRNTLSHANAKRDAGLAEKIFWKVVEDLGQLQPKFLQGKAHRTLRRFRRAAHAVDSTVIQFYRVKRRRIKKPQGKVIEDNQIVLRGPKSKKDYPGVLRRVVVRVEIDGVEQEMAFLTNNLTWSAQTIADLYCCRWEIEKFFRQIKQTLQLGDFLGNNENAVKWQIWTALLLYVLLRFMAYLSQWACPFTRLWAICRAVTWNKIDVVDLLKSYGTASPPTRMRAQANLGFLPGLTPVV